MSADPGLVEALREQLLDAEYTVDGVIDLLGPAAFGALGRGETVPALRATRGQSPLETLTRLFILQAPVAEPAARAALPALDRLADAALVSRGSDATVTALVDIRPYAADDDDFYVVSDLGTGIGGVTGPVRPDHVLGVGGASTTLAQLTVRPPVGRALDVGTGCGVQALHLSTHAQSVVATDTNPRALELAALTAGLSGRSFDLRAGSLLEPVEGERFDLIVSNPPFVVSPQARFMYRDGGHQGDDLCRSLVSAVPGHLAAGGWCQLLVNWLHVAGEDWRERVGSWVVPTGCDAWVVQREVQDPMEYVELWLRDAGDTGDTGDAGDAGGSSAYADLYDAWLTSFAEQRIEGVGFGWITLHASGSDQPFVRIEDLRQHVVQPLGPVVEDWFARHQLLRSLDDAELLQRNLVVAAGVVLEQEAAFGAGGLVPTSLRLRQTEGLCRSAAVDEVGVAVLSACDGRTPLASALASGLGDIVSEDGVEGALGSVRGLVEDGYLVPVD